MSTIHLEKNFEEYITRKLSELEKNGWVISSNDMGFDASTGLVFEDFLTFLKATMDEDKYEKLTSSSQLWKENIRRELVKNLENNGTLSVLREGFPMAGYKTIVCSGGIADDPRIPQDRKLYDSNILRVMRQVHYQTSGNKSLDLVFFINGIAVATAEIKTDFTQNVQDAIKEYQTERKPKESGNRTNPLLVYKRGAVVHFAISESEVWMYAGDLADSKPRFLPFNKGFNGHKGNAPMSDGDTDYPTGYFWNEICKRENWIRIFHNFIFEETSKKEDATGKIREVKKQLFPRFHQFDVVTKVLEDIRAKGVGQRYLIEHSAGSGKTETISWIAHELIRMNDSAGNRLFSSVIVVTDRIGLDSNIKNTIKQLKKTVGLIAMIGGDGDRKSFTAKSKELAKALIEKRDIVVVTLQTFPFALDAIRDNKSLRGASFAVLIDEAHNSQEGRLAAKFKAALKIASQGKRNEEETTDEDAINAYFLKLQSDKVMPENVSFFAFTATPKAETLTLFGRDSDRIDEKTGKPLPQSFHMYPMRQAIEEGYIIDVLKGYMPYSTAYKIREDIVKDKIVDERKALSTIAKWKALHPVNVMEKAEFIIEHFRRNVAHLLDGNAKAMIVTSSRASVVRYKYAISAYIEAKGYNKKEILSSLQFKVIGDPLVAFSDSIKGEKCVTKDDFDDKILSEYDYLKSSPFALIKKDYDYTEENINNLGGESIEKAFDIHPRNKILIVANKFQVGFNQPKLCAMYIDKRIDNDIEIVQTYSRLNRTHAGKEDVFIIDFVNSPDTVLGAFKKYDNGAELEKPQRLEIVYEIKKKLDDAEIYTSLEVEKFKKALYEESQCDEDSKDELRKKLYLSIDKPVSIWQGNYDSSYGEYVKFKRIEAELESCDEARRNEIREKIEKAEKQMDSLVDFRSKLKKFHSSYNYIAQIVDFEDEELEVFDSFCSLLSHRLLQKGIDEIDTRCLELEDYRIRPIEKTETEESHLLRPMGGGGRSKGARRDKLKHIIEKINEIWGEEEGLAEFDKKARVVNYIADFASRDKMSSAQVKNVTNDKEAVIADGRLEAIVREAANEMVKNELGILAAKVLKDKQSIRPLTEIVYDLLNEKKRIDISEILDYIAQDSNS